jgi:hypothetical protein
MTDAPRKQSFRIRREHTVAELLQAGWEVVEEPGRQTLPEPLRDFQPDILARRGSELLIVEVKSRRSSDLGRLNALASAVATMPNAKLEVNWLGDAPELDPPAENIRAYLDEAARLMSFGAFTAAVLVAWAALEGAVVYFASDKDDVEPWSTPWQLLSGLYSLGYVSDRDFERLTAFWKLRNEIAHHVSPVTPRAALPTIRERVNPTPPTRPARHRRRPGPRHRAAGCPSRTWPPRPPALEPRPPRDHDHPYRAHPR